MSIRVDLWTVYVQVFVLHQLMRLSWELMLAWAFIQQGNRNGVIYERDDQKLRHEERNTHSEKLRIVNPFILELLLIAARGLCWAWHTDKMPTGTCEQLTINLWLKCVMGWVISSAAHTRTFRAYLYVFQNQLNLLDINHFLLKQITRYKITVGQTRQFCLSFHVFSPPTYSEV